MGRLDNGPKGDQKNKRSYRRTPPLADMPADRRLPLRCRGASYITRVWVNGE